MLRTNVTSTHRSIELTPQYGLQLTTDHLQEGIDLASPSSRRMSPVDSKRFELLMEWFGKSK